MAQLEGLVIWSAVASASVADLSEGEHNTLLTNMGMTGTDDFKSMALSAEQNGVRFFQVINGDERTRFIVSEAN